MTFINSNTIIVCMIKKIRIKLGMSQQQLGDLTGRTQGAISGYETGRYPVDSDFAEQLINICSSHGIDMDYNKIYGYEPEQVANG